MDKLSSCFPAFLQRETTGIPTEKHLLSAVSNFRGSTTTAYFNFGGHDLPWRLIVEEILRKFVTFLSYFFVY